MTYSSAEGLKTFDKFDALELKEGDTYFSRFRFLTTKKMKRTDFDVILTSLDGHIDANIEKAKITLSPKHAKLNGTLFRTRKLNDVTIN